MQLFYSQHITKDSALFDPNETSHALQVLRLKKGDTIHFTDGCGNLYQGLIHEMSKKEFTAQAIVPVKKQEEPHHKIHLYVSPTKITDRFEWLVEKASELGIWSVTPLMTSRTIKKNVNLTRLKNLALSAMKQSLQLHLTSIHEPLSIEEIDFNGSDNQFYFGYCGDEEKRDLHKIVFTEKNIHFLIGPEGDFTEKEVAWLLSKKANPTSFGETRLRTETAALYVASVLKHNLLQ